MRVSRAEEESFDLPLTPLIDMMFMLLIFFLVSTTIVNPEKDVTIDLPDAAESDNPRAETANFIVNLRSGGIIVVEQSIISIDELLTRLEQIAEETPGRVVEIRGDKTAPYGTAVQILQTCRELELNAVLPTIMRE